MDFWTPTTVAIPLATAIGTTVWRQRTTHTTKTHQVIYLPNEHFAPSPQATLAFATQTLARLQRQRRLPATRRTFEVGITTVGHNGKAHLVWWIHAPSDIVPTIGHHFEGLSAFPAEYLLPLPDIARTTKQIHLWCKRKPVSPLCDQTSSNEEHVWTTLARAVHENVTPDTEHAEVRLCLRALTRTERTRRRQLQRLLNDTSGTGKRKQGETDVWKQAERALAGVLATQPERVSLARTLRERDTRGLCAARFTIQTAAPTKARANELCTILQQALTATTRAGEQSLARTRHRVSRRDRVRQHPKHTMHLDALAVFLRPPSGKGNNTLPLLRQEHLASTRLPTWSHGQPLLPLGTINDLGGPRIVGLPLRDYLCGAEIRPTGGGKTWTWAARILALAELGQSIIVVDPGRDLFTLLRELLPSSANLVEISIAPTAPATHVSWNPFAMTGRSRTDIAQRAQDLTFAIQHARKWPDSAAVKITATHNTVTALLELGALLPPNLQPTIFQMADWLEQDAWRDSLLRFLPPSEQEYWANSRTGKRKDPQLTQLYDTLRKHPGAAALLGQPENLFSFRDAIDNGKIVLVQLDGSGPVSKILAGLVIAELRGALFSRVDIPENQRRPCWIFFDEAPYYGEAILSMVLTILFQGRKYGARMTLAAQQWSALLSELAAALAANRSYLAGRAKSVSAAATLAAELNTSPENIIDLSSYAAMTQIEMDGKRLPSFPVTGLDPYKMFPRSSSPRAPSPPNSPPSQSDIEGIQPHFRQKILTHLRNPCTTLPG